MASIDIRSTLLRTSIDYLPIGTNNPGSGIGQLISRIFTIALVFAGLAVFLYLILAGYNWLTAGGDKGKVEEARTRITNALIGLAIVASSLVIGSLVNNFFGTGVTSSTINTPPGNELPPYLPPGVPN